jgi:hypothetical protein
MIIKPEAVLAIFSLATGTIAVVSLLVGKSPYLGFFGRNFIARRKRDPGHYWVSVAFYAAVCIVLASGAVVIRIHR